ncbi:unnamed protein product [Acanthoscelides obtectus]|uniref:Transforming growth factor beta regulator 1 n=1 Tax=Acanthoscelides obtectus TaxID=200917 RepID=A0A9P0KHA4_ACAOB|nr:unnamed protein product [Acanthoscelides obtectus]CAK1677212.1 Transforming growth factor beta regulator 1 [Acanthoscelides obtectus]
MAYNYSANNKLKNMQMVSNNRNAGKYKQKLLYLKQMIREYVHENAALVDEIEEIQMKIIMRKEERKFLLRKLCEYEPQVVLEVQKASKDSVSSSGTQLKSSDKKRKKKILGGETSVNKTTVVPKTEPQ